MATRKAIFIARCKCERAAIGANGGLAKECRTRQGSQVRVGVRMCGYKF